MFTKRIGTGAPALLAALLLGASGLAGCATDEDAGGPFAGERETYEPAGEPYNNDYYGGRFEEEGVAGQGPEGAEPFGERYDSGPWGGQDAYGGTSPREGEMGVPEGEAGVPEEGTRNPFDTDY